MKRKNKILLFIISIIFIIRLIHSNYILNNSYRYYLEANKLTNNKLNYEKFCEENKIFFAD